MPAAGSSETGLVIYDYFISLGFSPFWASTTRAAILVCCLFLIVVLFSTVIRSYLLKLINKATAKSPTSYDDILAQNKVFRRASLLIPALCIYLFDDFIFAQYPGLIRLFRGIANVYSVVIIAWVIDALLKSVQHVMETRKAFENKPLTSYRQLVSILNYGVAIILVISIIIDRSPMYLLSALGAATAVLLLLFRDSLLGFTASIQLASNDMIRVGDWITVKAYGADGTVTEINLSTVKVINFDNTISTVPTYSLISNSFVNWRGMQTSGGRRIKRALNIHTGSIQMCTPQMLEDFKRIKLIQPYIEEKSAEIEQFNTQGGVSKEVLVNGRNLTNIGLFRKYTELYLAQNPNINQDLTLMVRQLSPTAEGLPLEVYCFSRNKDWVVYEGIMADIFDHLLAVAPYFHLEVFQNPSGTDFHQLQGKD
ncbi:mechanosensitive ion channel [bacterium SCSIO 12741]|nr:mechanosensitive ion channel [bacterium SCSIO 12741]